MGKKKKAKIEYKNPLKKQIEELASRDDDNFNKDFSTEYEP